ncbi:MAG: PAS domain S-box protein [Prolixibacteraceae bacterium]|nr:PAS domain S-box protein [Prolixibacteraceae bacterium]MBN2773483.1 PAS domain S-box protein [Prolixibacteraceae bacterium]
MSLRHAIKILILEDSSEDVELNVRILQKNLEMPFNYKLAQNRNEYIQLIHEYNPDIILSDYQLPGFNGLEALKIALKGIPGIPFIIVTGSVNEETAVNCMKAGAWDYVIKENLIRLVPAINSAIEKQKYIIAQKNTSDALEKSERELTAIFNNTPAVIMVVSDDLKIIKINKTGLQISNKQFDEMFGKPIGYALLCKYCNNIDTCGNSEECANCGIKNLIKSTIRSGKNKNTTETIIESEVDGMFYTRMYLCYFEQLYDKPEKTALLTLIDITDRKNTEKKLIESEQKFRELADTLPEIVFEIDKDGKFEFLNKKAFQKYNLDLNSTDIRQLKLTDFIHPEDLEKIFDNMSRVFTGEKFSGNDYKSKLPDGTTGYFQIFNSPIIKNNKVTGIRGIAIDISERKKLEVELTKHKEQLEELVLERTKELEKKAAQIKESQLALSFLLDDVNESREELMASNREIKKLSQALEQSPTSVIITNIEGNIEYVNKKFTLVSGYTFEEAIGKNPRILNSGKHSKEFFIQLWDKIISGKNWYGEICNKKKNGNLYWEYTSISPLRNSEDKIINFIAVKDDITERKEIEEKLKEYTEELEVFNKAMVDRELKIIEMKEEVNRLCDELGREQKYPPVWNEKNIIN